MHKTASKTTFNFYCENTIEGRNPAYKGTNENIYKYLSKSECPDNFEFKNQV